MTTVAVGPYEHTGPYTTTELFDTTGTPSNFCSECEHAPCITGRNHHCTTRPRSITVGAVRQDIFDMLGQHYDNPLARALRNAVYGLGDSAGSGSTDWVAQQESNNALSYLAQVRADLAAIA